MTGKETHDTPLDVRAALTRAFNAGVSYGTASHKDFVQIHEPVHVVVQSLVGRVCKPLPPNHAETWRQIVEDCKSGDQRSINVGSTRRRQAILAVDSAMKKNEDARRTEYKYRLEHALRNSVAIWRIGTLQECEDELSECRGLTTFNEADWRIVQEDEG